MLTSLDVSMDLDLPIYGTEGSRAIFEHNSNYEADRRANEMPTLVWRYVLRSRARWLFVGLNLTYKYIRCPSI